MIDANPVPALAEYRLAKPEFLQVPTADGFVMEALMIKPPDFNPARRYPVYQFTYGGPHNQQVLNAWGGSDYMHHQMLAERGITSGFATTARRAARAPGRPDRPIETLASSS